MAARWIVWSEPTPLRDLRRLNPGGWRAEGPRTWLMAAGVGAVSGLLALGEIPVSMLLTPPAPSPPISVTLLNAMHYQRPDTVVAVLALLVVVGLVVASGLGGASLVMARRVSNAPAVLLLAFSIMLVGCSSDPEEGPVPLTVDSIIGGAGHAPGRFDYPRAIDVDAQTGELFVVDKSGRVQRLDPEGRPLASWTMPRINQGRPTGITIGPRGNIWVADTHEHRVMVYGPDGEWKQQVGSYGTGPGQFIYPTDIAFGDDDVVFVSEYGGNDRIQVFTIDGEWIRTIGGTGTAPGMFDRPQSMCISPDGRTMAVADSRNQRIQLMDLASGDWRVLRQGGYEGDLRTPFSVWFRDDGSLLVSDTGTNLLLHLSADGEILAANGGWGWGPGQLRDPWAVVEQGGTTLVLDSGNNRILRLNPGEP